MLVSYSTQLLMGVFRLRVGKRLSARSAACVRLVPAVHVHVTGVVPFAVERLAAYGANKLRGVLSVPVAVEGTFGWAECAA